VSAVASFPAAPFRSHLRHRIGVFAYDSLFHRTEHQMPRGKIERPVKIVSIKNWAGNRLDKTHMSLLLPDHDRRFQMYMDDDQQFFVTWLEKKMFDIGEKYVCMDSQ
jgi:hypothetical protein